jgi:hypothetical protein
MNSVDRIDCNLVACTATRMWSSCTSTPREISPTEIDRACQCQPREVDSIACITHRPNPPKNILNRQKCWKVKKRDAHTRVDACKRIVFVLECKSCAYISFKGRSHWFIPSHDNAMQQLGRSTIQSMHAPVSLCPDLYPHGGLVGMMLHSKKTLPCHENSTIDTS